jgi:hypothetical protein
VLFRSVNNIINNTNNGYAYTITSGGSPLTSDFNNIRNSTTTCSSCGTNVGFSGGISRTSPSAWYSGTFQDINSTSRWNQITFLPAPFDTYIGDINVVLRGDQNISNINGGNTNVDIDGTLRRNPPMIGAHEVVPVVAFGGTALDSTCVRTSTVINSLPLVSSLKPYQYALPSGGSRVSYQWSSSTSRAVANGKTRTRFIGACDAKYRSLYFICFIKNKKTKSRCCNGGGS